MYDVFESCVLSIWLWEMVSNFSYYTGWTYNALSLSQLFSSKHPTHKLAICRQPILPGKDRIFFVENHNYYGNMTYCKRGYFRWGKISRKCWQDISRGGNFHDTTPFSFIKAYGSYFRVGVIFAKKTKARKTRKLPPRENFHVYSSLLFQIHADV